MSLFTMTAEGRNNPEFYAHSHGRRRRDDTVWARLFAVSPV